MEWKRVVAALGIAWLLFNANAAASTLNGFVVDAKTSKPIAGASVAVDVLIPDSISLYATSASAGEYLVGGLPPDNAIYVIRCHVPGYASFYMRYDLLAAGDRQLDILMQPSESAPPGTGGDSATVYGIVLYEPPGGGRNPINQAVVTLASGGSQSVAHTGTDGKYSLRVRRSSYGLSVSAPGFQNLTGTGVPVDSTGLTLNVLLKSTAVSVPSSNKTIPATFSLGNAFPNPFNPSTTITFGVPSDSRVSIKVYNLLGGVVATMIEGVLPAGYHTVRFNGSSLPSGVYVYRMTGRPLDAGQGAPVVHTRRMLLLK